MKSLAMVLFVLVLVLLLASPAHAQDVTAPDAPAEGNATAINLITLIAGIGVGVVAGGGSVLFVVDRLRNDPTAIAAVEYLGQSFPPETRELLNHLAGFLYEATDDVPYKDKPTSGSPNLN